MNCETSECCNRGVKLRVFCISRYSCKNNPPVSTRAHPTLVSSGFIMNLVYFWQFLSRTHASRTNDADLLRLSIRVIRVRQEVVSQIALSATPSIRGNPTAKRAGGNARALSSQDNVESQKVRFGQTARVKTL